MSAAAERPGWTSPKIPDHETSPFPIGFFEGENHVR